MTSRRGFLKLLGAGALSAAVGGSAVGYVRALRDGAPEPPLPDAVGMPPVSVTAGGIRIHALRTGLLTIKEAHRTATGPAALRLPSILLDPHWTEPLPILAWVVEHPEGVIVVDSGEVAAASDPASYFEDDPRLGWFVTNNFRLWVAPAEEIGAQLRALDIDPGSVRWLVQTHLHFDHVGGIGAFARSEIVVARREIEAPPEGAAPILWPDWYAPAGIEYRSAPLGPFDTSYPLTRAGDVRLLPTPGHTRGHQSLVLDDGERLIVFAGDAAFSEARLLAGRLDGISADPGAAADSMARLLELARQRSTVFLPSHDPASPARLAELRPVGG